MEKFKDAKRISDTLLAPLERKALGCIVKRLPNGMHPDHLTVITIISSVLIGISYYLTNVSNNFLWLASLGFILNWFGDSLDGTLARYRHIERPKYGFFVDHVTDAITEFIIVLGLGLSPYIRLDIALYCLAGYLMLSILTYINTYVQGMFQLSYGKLGPTEVRLMFIILNALLYFGTNAGAQIERFNLTLTFLDVVGLVVGTIFIIIFIIFSLKHRSMLAKIDPPKNFKNKQ
jgi:phosphatidylglycerophosphate synthase